MDPPEKHTDKPLWRALLAIRLCHEKKSKLGQGSGPALLSFAWIATWCKEHAAGYHYAGASYSKWWQADVCGACAAPNVRKFVDAHTPLAGSGSAA
jgi:hypothetical protein